MDDATLLALTREPTPDEVAMLVAATSSSSQLSMIARRLAFQAESLKPRSCGWSCDNESYWSTDCGLGYFLECEPEEFMRGWKYCPKCGQPFTDPDPGGRNEE